MRSSMETRKDREAGEEKERQDERREGKVKSDGNNGSLR